MLFTLAACLFSCQSDENGNQENKDSLATNTPDTSAKNPVQPKKEEPPFETEYTEVAEKLRSPEKLKELDKYIQPGVGFYVINSGPGAYQEYQHYNSFEGFGGGDGPGPEAVSRFLENVKKSKAEDLKLQYTDLTDIYECNFEKRGTFAVLVTQNLDILSGLYENLQKQIDQEADKAELDKLNDAEGSITTKVIMNIFESKGDKYAETIYFSMVGDNWYITAIDLSECGA